MGGGRLLLWLKRNEWFAATLEQGAWACPRGSRRHRSWKSALCSWPAHETRALSLRLRRFLPSVLGSGGGVWSLDHRTAGAVQRISYEDSSTAPASCHLLLLNPDKLNRITILKKTRALAMYFCCTLECSRRRSSMVPYSFPGRFSQQMCVPVVCNYKEHFACPLRQCDMTLCFSQPTQ